MILLHLHDDPIRAGMTIPILEMCELGFRDGSCETKVTLLGRG